MQFNAQGEREHLEGLQEVPVTGGKIRWEEGIETEDASLYPEKFMATMTAHLTMKNKCLIKR